MYLTQSNPINTGVRFVEISAFREAFLRRPPRLLELAPAPGAADFQAKIDTAAGMAALIFCQDIEKALDKTQPFDSACFKIHNVDMLLSVFEPVRKGEKP